ncbi:site-specific DNA-methyltransferase [Tabrizicola sp.]|uniref:site-specific DNA-methyltransferase n=1 Tax=Tabrizicola sp. TaxID=2005166 RepID=UPI0035B2132C
MATGKTRLELTWIGKDIRPRLEPRILIEDPEFSHHAEARREGNIFDNVLIHGDNLLALKALETDPNVRGEVKCVFIDPPYNTGSAFEHYDDGLEHSLWLGMMRDRLEIIWNLLSKDGSLWIAIDDNEGHYLKVMCDEIFGRRCFISDTIWRTSDSSNNNVTKFSLDHNSLLVYAKDPDWRPNFLNDPSKRKHFKNPDNDPRGPWFDGNNMQNPGLRPNLQFDVVSPQGYTIKHPPNGWRWSRETIDAKMKTGEIRFSPDGKRLIRRTYLSDQSGLPPSSLWVDLDETGHNRQAKYELKNLFPEIPVTSLFGTPKPERLLRKVMEVATNPGDLVLDSFAGSGTTGAVAHKMGRRWIMVELGEHAKTHIVPRLNKVIDGQDKGGVTEAAGWKGGGGYRFFRLAPSLLEKDQWGNWVIRKEYNPAMLAEAMCKHFNYTYAPSTEHYWMHGQSSETSFIYVTTNSLTFDQLRAISDEVGESRSLLICCTAYESGADRLANLTLRKIPQAVLAACEWGKDDYSLKIESLPMMAEEEEDLPAAKPVPRARRDTDTGDLFATGTDDDGEA